jgi:hypothetical protein
MIKKITYILIPTCMTLSAAMADSLPSNPMLLSADQMDQVTAGAGAVVSVGATGDSSFFAMTHTNAVAQTGVSNTDTPALAGYVEVAGGGAVAVAAGQGATTSTTVSPATDSQGSAGSYTIQVNGHIKSPLAEIQSNIIYTSGSMFVNPL